MNKGLTKAEKLKDAVIKFEDSDKQAGDYIALLAVGSMVTRQGDGMVWGDVQEVISATLIELYA